MKKVKIFILLSLVTLGSVLGNIENYSKQEITGIWLGTMKVSDALELSVAYVISEGKGGELSATLNIIEQKAFDIPMDTVILSDGQISIDFSEAGISYIGQYNEGTNSIDGVYTQGESNFELILSQVDELPGPVERTQLPMEPFPYTVEEVTFTNSDANVDLAGTLSLPGNGNSFPAIILVHGSGHTDRNETSMGHFLLLSDFFTRNGFIVLRFDKRGVGSSTGNYDEATTYDFARDVEAGIKYLRTRSDVDANNIGIIGHSEGSLIAPMIAAEDQDIAYFIMMGAMGYDGGEIRIQQTEKISRLNGVPDEQIQKELTQIRNYHDVVISEKSNESKFNTIKEMYPNMTDGMINYILKPWYQTFIQLDPVEFLNEVSCPVLAISGEKDLQCIPEVNLPRIENALKKSKSNKYSVETLPSLNHLFQTCKTGLPIEYENIAEIISPSALQLMLKWIQSI